MNLVSDCRFGVSPVNYPDPDLHGPLTSVKCFGPGRFSKPISGRKFIFHKRIYLYERSKHDLMTYISQSIDFGLWPV